MWERSQGRQDEVVTQPPGPRAYYPDDHAALSDICVRTADNGGDSRHLYPDPELMPSIFAAPPARTPSEEMIALLYNPERMIVPEMAAHLAHLHIDLLPARQRQGFTTTGPAHRFGEHGHDGVNGATGCGHARRGVGNVLGAIRDAGCGVSGRGPVSPARWFGASPSPPATPTWPGRKDSARPERTAYGICAAARDAKAEDQCAQDRSGRAGEPGLTPAHCPGTVGAVHLSMLTANTPARAFYDRLGYAEIDVPDPGPVTYLGRSTTPDL
ncbi:hypothetical protein GCM10018966_015380 [Streptomyces yanii]